MSGYNRVILMGNLGMDPELKYSQAGSAILRIRLAASEKWKDKQGQFQERTEWVTVVFFGNRAEGLGKVLKKGDRVLVEGKLRTRDWDDKDGNKRYTTEVIGDNLAFGGGGNQQRSTSPQRSGDGGPTRAGQGGGTRGDFPADDFGDDDIPF